MTTSQIGLRLNEQTQSAFDNCNKHGLSTTGFISQLIVAEWARQKSEQNRIKTLTDYGTGLAAKILYLNYEHNADDRDEVLAEIISSEGTAQVLRSLMNNKRLDLRPVLNMLPKNMRLQAQYAKPTLDRFSAYQYLKKNYLYDQLVIPNGLLDAVSTAKQLHNELARKAVYSYKRFYDDMAIAALEAILNSQFTTDTEELLKAYKAYEQQ